MREEHQKLADFIWNIANKLRGPYRPPQYRRVMLPLIVLRRLDCVLEPTKDEVLKQYQSLKANKKLSPEAVEKALAKVASKDRKQPLYNISHYTFQQAAWRSERHRQEPHRLHQGLLAQGPRDFREVRVREGDREARRDQPPFRGHQGVRRRRSSSRTTCSNIAMGYVFENLIRRFNEQANEEAGDHFTPREVIRLMAHLIYTGDEDDLQARHLPHDLRPGLRHRRHALVSEEYIREHNDQRAPDLFGQDYNAEAYAICCSDMLIKDEPVDNIVHGDTLGDGKTRRPPRQDVPLHAGQSALRRGVEAAGRTLSRRSTRNSASTGASGRACRASMTARCSSCCT